MGYGFYWPPFGKPKMVDPNGRNIPLEVHHYCPYILDHSRVPEKSASPHVAPATSSPSSNARPRDVDGYDSNEVQADNVAEASTTPRVIQTVKPSLTSAEDTNPERATGGEALPADG